MIGFWISWLATMQFSCEAQSVVAQRLFLFAIGGAGAAVEADRMVAEKFAAFGRAHSVAERALADGQDIFMASEQAFASVRDCVHANCIRLSGRMH